MDSVLIVDDVDAFLWESGPRNERSPMCAPAEPAMTVRAPERRRGGNEPQRAAHTLACEFAHVTSRFRKGQSQRSVRENPRSRATMLQSVAHLIEQRLRVLQVGGVEALGEPVVDIGEHRARLVAAVSVAQQARERGSRGQC